MTKLLAALTVFFGVIVLAFGLSLVMAYPTVWAINALFTAKFLFLIFGTAKVGFWQGWLINFVSAILFKSYNTTSKG